MTPAVWEPEARGEGRALTLAEERMLRRATSLARISVVQMALIVVLLALLVGRQVGF